MNKKELHKFNNRFNSFILDFERLKKDQHRNCLLYTSPSPRDTERSRMPSSA